MKNKNIHFIDCGSNVGTAIDWVKERYKDSNLKVDAFEPEFINYSAILEKSYKEEYLNIKAHFKAVWVADEIKTFYIQNWGSRTGSSIFGEKTHTLKKGQIVPRQYLGIPVSVGEERNSGLPPLFKKDIDGNPQALEDLDLIGPLAFLTQCIDLSAWIKTNVSKENFNILKLDIEGAEYQVVRHLLDTEAHEYIDQWMVEFTPQKKVPDLYDSEVIKRLKSIAKEFINWS